MHYSWFVNITNSFFQRDVDTIKKKKLKSIKNSKYTEQNKILFENEIIFYLEYCVQVIFLNVSE